MVSSEIEDLPLEEDLTRNCNLLLPLLLYVKSSDRNYNL